jgi:hypothetical protein
MTSRESIGSAPRSRVIIRGCVVFVLTVVMIAANAADFRRIWIPLGVLGFSTDGNGVVTAVSDHRLPGARAGMRVGDRVDLASTPPQYRAFVYQIGYTPEPGNQVTFRLVSGRSSRDVTLTSVPQGPYEKAVGVTIFGVALLFILIGATVVLLRPSVMTWGFFFYCLGYAPGNQTVFNTAFPGLVGFYTADVFLALISLGGSVGLLVFALYFLSEPLKRWRRTILNLVPWLTVILVAFTIVQLYETNWVGSRYGELFLRIWLASNAAPLILAVYVFADTYAHARGSDRPRMRWVLVGIGISIIASYIVASLLQYYAPNTTNSVTEALQMTNVLVPVSVAYAVLKHRVLDVNFVLRRSVVYATLVAVLIGIFSLTDWIFAQKPAATRLEFAIDLAAALCLGVSVGAGHGRLIVLFDRLLFRKRYTASMRLEAARNDLQRAASSAEVDATITSGVAHALGLSSAAVFKRMADGGFLREAGIGWPDEAGWHLLPSDPLVRYVQRQPAAATLRDIHWTTERVSDVFQPEVMFPIPVGRRVEGIAMYGAHASGTSLDPDEVGALTRLAKAAGDAYGSVGIDGTR